MYLKMEKEQAAGLLKEAYEKLKVTEELKSCALLEQALDLDFENEEIKHALKCVHWWLEHIRRIEDIKNSYEKGVFVISLLKHYHVFLGQFDKVFDQCQYAVRYFVYARALSYFNKLLESHANQRDHGLLLMLGRCHKGLGEYDKALSYLEQAVHLKREDAETLAELADINALLAQTKAAKALFREAFFLDPAKVEIRTLESALILKLRGDVSALGYKDEEICEWMPVYGYLWGVFSIKRELKQAEVGRLKQSIFSLEAECAANSSRREQLKPRLLNKYFWLIDHHEISHEDPSLIEETLLKIQVTDPDIYKMYTG